MLKGLEISEVSFNQVFSGTSTFRIDPEYFQRSHLFDEALLARRGGDFSSMAELGIAVDASAFYPSIEGYYSQGDLPFLRVADVDTVIDFAGCTTIPAELCDMHPTLAKVSVGDILFTKGGSIARIGLVKQLAAVSRDLIFLNTSKLSRADQNFLYSYFQTDFFNRALLRSSSQTAQPHLTITLVRELLVLRATDQLKKKVSDLVDAGYAALSLADKAQSLAETVLVDELDLGSWVKTSDLTYTASSADVFANGRLDAEYFQPKFGVLLDHIALTGEQKRLADCLTSYPQRGTQPIYDAEGTPVVNSKHVLRGEVRLNKDNRRAVESDDCLLITYGDVLINGTGVGTIGRSAPYLHVDQALPDNHVTVLRPHSWLDPIYLSVFLNSVAGRWQVEQRLRGSSGQIEIYPTDLAEFTVWVAPEPIQSRIRKAVEESFKQRQLGEHCLLAAKNAVEIATTDSEKAALDYLENVR